MTPLRKRFFTVAATLCLAAATVSGHPAQAAHVAQPAPAASPAHRAPTPLAQQLPGAAPVYWNPAAVWSETYFRTPDGVELHADIMRPAHLPSTVKTPVILSIGPYFNHLADLGIFGILSESERTAELLSTKPGAPNPRFKNFITQARLMEQGYTWVQVDLRGTGASTGCLDFNGPGEQTDVVTAIKWAASQPWSTGKVGMYGKSYDASTGLIGLKHHPQGLSAVVAQEPAYDPYTYLFHDQVARPNVYGTPLAYNQIALSPGDLLRDNLHYQRNATWEYRGNIHCIVNNQVNQNNPDADSAFWRSRRFIEAANRSPVPLFVMHGLIEDNTHGTGIITLLQGRKAPTRAWLGMWNHIRGNEKNDQGRWQTGRSDYIQQVMDFFNRYLKGQNTRRYAPIYVNDNTGRWHTQTSWPQVTDHATFPGPSGSVQGIGTSVGARTTGDGGAMRLEVAKSQNTEPGIWKILPAQTQLLHISGNLTINATVKNQSKEGWPTTLIGDIYDVTPEGKAILITRAATRVRPDASSGENGGSTQDSTQDSTQGTSTVTLRGIPNDWVLQPGHRLAIRLVTSNVEEYLPLQSPQPIEVLRSELVVDVDGNVHPSISGGMPIYLELYLKEAGLYPGRVPGTAGPVAMK